MFLQIASAAAWTGALVVVSGAVASAAVAIRIRQPALALFALLPLAAAYVAIAAGVRIAPPHPAFWIALAVGLAVLGVVGGNPVTVLVLDLAARGTVPGEHGGILVAQKGARTRHEVLRGGTWIGYLERVGVAAAVVTLRFEILAAVIAIKGLGRFSELDAPEARERFIIGTLVSMIWAAACVAPVVLA